MDVEDNFFAKYTPKYTNLIKYGFQRTDKSYFFDKVFMNNKFKARIIVSSNGKVSGKVYDLDFNDEYLPMNIKNHKGDFVSNVRKSYTKILKDIRDECFIGNYFVSQQANRISDIIMEKYGDKPIFMWKKFPSDAVFKNPDTGKWYGVIMNIKRSKIDKESNGYVDIINIKLDKAEVQDLLHKNGFYPAWHMNKKSWITIVMDDTLKDNEIINYVDISHSFSLNK